MIRGMRCADSGMPPAMPVTMVVTLALGLGTVTAMLAVVDSVLLRPVALPHPEQLVMISGRPCSCRANIPGSRSVEKYAEETRLFRDVSSYQSQPDADRHTRTGCEWRCWSGPCRTCLRCWACSGAGPIHTAGDGEAPVAVVNAAFARERMHGAGKAVGATIKVSGQSRTVSVCCPDGVHFPQGVGGPDCVCTAACTIRRSR